MFTCNIIILVKVGKHSKKLKLKNKNESKNNQKLTNRTRSLALMLIPVNILFLLFLGPLVIAMFAYDKLGEDSLTLAILEFWSYFNFTFNFFIYFLTSSKFRDESTKMFSELCFIIKISEVSQINSKPISLYKKRASLKRRGYTV